MPPPMPPCAAAAAIAASACRIGLVGDQRFGRQDAGGDGRGVLQRSSRDLGRVDDTGGDHVAVGLAVGVVAIAELAARTDLLVDDGAIHTAFSAIWRIGACRALAMMEAPVFSSPESFATSFSTAGIAFTNAVPPPATMPSSTAARVAFSASSTRSFCPSWRLRSARRL